jgi:hypothetical protein
MLFQVFILPAPFSRVLTEKPIVAQAVKKSCVFYGTRISITGFTKTPTLDFIVSQMNPVHPAIRISLICIYCSSHLRPDLQMGLFPSDFSIKIYVLLIPPMCATCPTLLLPPLFDHRNNVFLAVSLYK